MRRSAGIKGVRVVVVRETDQEARTQFRKTEAGYGRNDRIFESRSSAVINKRGVILGLVKPHGNTGDTEADPLIRVRLSDGRVGAFWPEELRPRLRDLRGLRVRMVEGHGVLERGAIVEVAHVRADGMLTLQTVGRNPVVKRKIPRTSIVLSSPTAKPTPPPQSEDEKQMAGIKAMLDDRTLWPTESGSAMSRGLSNAMAGLRWAYKRLEDFGVGRRR